MTVCSEIPANAPASMCVPHPANEFESHMSVRCLSKLVCFDSLDIRFPPENTPDCCSCDRRPEVCRLAGFFFDNRRFGLFVFQIFHLGPDSLCLSSTAPQVLISFPSPHPDTLCFNSAPCCDLLHPKTSISAATHVTCVIRSGSCSSADQVKISPGRSLPSSSSSVNVSYI